MPIIYPDIRNLINKKPYLIHEVPVTYGPAEMFFLDKNSAGPIYTPSKRQRSTGRYTIASLIDMYFNKVDFVFDSYSQMREIEKYLGIYLAVMENSVDRHLATREHTEYLNRAKQLFMFLQDKVQKQNKREQTENLKKNPFLSTMISVSKDEE